MLSDTNTVIYEASQTGGIFNVKLFTRFDHSTLGKLKPKQD